MVNGTQVNGTLKSQYFYGETIYLMCKNGYRWDSGSDSRTCTIDSTWSGEDLICERKFSSTLHSLISILFNHTLAKTCQIPYPRAKMARYSPAQTMYGADDYVIYSCLDGYQLTNGTLNRTCLDDGSWSGSAPICETPPGEDPATNVAHVSLQPTEAKHAAAIGIPVGAIFLGSLFGTLAMLDLLSIPKYYEFARRRLRKSNLMA